MERQFKRSLQNIMITGGSGFIGSNFIRYLFEKTGFTGKIINFDKLTYAGNPENLNDLYEDYGGLRYFFEHADICDGKKVHEVLNRYKIDTIVHFAAESHVDRSILGPAEFVQTNLMGTFTLLETVRSTWEGRHDVLFHHVSTDEVFGSLGETGYFSETTAYDPRSPYSASKAGSDHLVRAYWHTYGLPVTMSNCSNNYGPYHFPEKLIPLMILNMLEGKPLPVYGDGKNVRDWLYVEDHAAAIHLVLNNGRVGESYNIGGENEWENLKLVHVLCETVAGLTGAAPEQYKSLIKFVPDRKGHDRRYAIDCSKIKQEIGWHQSVVFEEGLRKTVEWYLANPEWVDHVKTGSYKSWIETNYDKRGYEA